MYGYYKNKKLKLYAYYQNKKQTIELFLCECVTELCILQLQGSKSGEKGKQSVVMEQKSDHRKQCFITQTLPAYISQNMSR